jgi:polar amino acid transport system substrate-binding protein
MKARAFPLSLLLLAAALANARADGLDSARQRGKLVAGLHYVVPEYKAGMKFRTPEALDTALAEELAKRLQLPLTTVRTPGKADLALAAVADNDPLRRTAAVIPTGYAAGPMAIMRTDTDIKAWEHLKGRKVCVAEGGRYAGTLAAKYGAIEKVHKAPADSLLALRIGECDAAVHDSAMLEELIKLPEWKKFSARLPVGARTTLAFVVPAADRKSAALLKQVTDDWSAQGYPEQLMKKTVRQIAFEVYLDQDVPDCH